MKILLILLLSISIFSCKEPVNPFLPEKITNSESKEEINQARLWKVTRNKTVFDPVDFRLPGLSTS